MFPHLEISHLKCSPLSEYARRCHLALCISIWELRLRELMLIVWLMVMLWIIKSIISVLEGSCLLPASTKLWQDNCISFRVRKSSSSQFLTLIPYKSTKSQDNNLSISQRKLSDYIQMRKCKITIEFSIEIMGESIKWSHQILEENSVTTESYNQQKTFNIQGNF